MIRYLTIICLCFALFTSCKKNNEKLSEAEILSFAMPKATSIDINRDKRLITVYMDDLISRTSLVASFQLSQSAVASVNGQTIESSQTALNYSNEVTYSVKAEDGTVINWTVSVVNNYEKVGLGTVLTSKTLPSTAPWYVDQLSSGLYSTTNGGAACLAMIYLWENPGASIDATAIRSDLDTKRKAIYDSAADKEEVDAFKNPGLPFYTSDLTDYLTARSFPYQVISLSNVNNIAACVDKGYAVILCLDINKIKYEANRVYRIEKFYETTNTFGHYIIVKGYKQLADSSYYFEVYDPYSMGQTYSDTGLLKGLSRYYRSDYVEAATNSYWGYAIVVGPKNKQMEQLSGVVSPQNAPIESGN